jgi:hypothetical protein
MYLSSLLLSTRLPRPSLRKRREVKASYEASEARCVSSCHDPAPNTGRRMTSPKAIFDACRNFLDHIKLYTHTHTHSIHSKHMGRCRASDPHHEQPQAPSGQSAMNRCSLHMSAAMLQPHSRACMQVARPGQDSRCGPRALKGWRTRGATAAAVCVFVRLKTGSAAGAAPRSQQEIGISRIC